MKFVFYQTELHLGQINNLLSTLIETEIDQQITRTKVTQQLSEDFSEENKKKMDDNIAEQWDTNGSNFTSKQP